MSGWLLILLGFLGGVVATCVFLLFYLGFIRLPFTDDRDYDY